MFWRAVSWSEPLFELPMPVGAQLPQGVCEMQGLGQKASDKGDWPSPRVSQSRTHARTVTAPLGEPLCLAAWQRALTGDGH